MIDLRFELDANISLSELRNEKELTERLGHFHKLRVQRRGDTVGVLISRDEWQDIAEAIKQYESLLEEAEDAVVKRIIDERADGEPKSGDAFKRDITKRLTARGLL